MASLASSGRVHVPSATHKSAVRARAYELLGVRAEDVAALPQVTPQLRMIVKTTLGSGVPVKRLIEEDLQSGTRISTKESPRAPYGPGGDLLSSWAYYLEASPDEDARRILRCYNDLPRYYARTLPIEAFCLAAGVPPVRALSLLTEVVVRFGVQASAIIAAVNQPRVVQKTVEMAMTDDGFADRALFHKATGFTPTPKGAQINIHASANAAAGSTAQAATVPAPQPEGTIRRLIDRFNDARGLPPADTARDVDPAALVPRERDAIEVTVPPDDDDEDNDADDAEEEA